MTEKGRNRAEIVYEDNSSICPLLVVIHSISVSADWFSATGKAFSSENRLLLEVPEYTTFKDGDVLSSKDGSYIFILNTHGKYLTSFYASLAAGKSLNISDNLAAHENHIECYRFATDSEKQKEQDGLKQKWEGRVWLNPPYSRPTIEHFITRMVEHNNGIALLFNRLDNKMFQDVVFPKAKGILFMKGRIKFHREDGTIGESPGCGSILVAFGEENAEILRSSNIEGRYIQVNQEPCSTHVDWEQRRYEMAKTMLPITSVSGRGPHGELILEACDKAAELAVIYADALIKELK